jgi:aryl-alcohol dehydrogenase-like predicted oxidoreductase
MEYRSLGRTGVQVSPLCLGGMLFGEQTDEAEALAIIDRALDAGLNFVDTANIYTRGHSEAIIGRALRRDGRRARVVLATKVHGRMDDDDPNAWGNSRRHILEQCEASLRRLQTEVIDLYQLHRPLSTIPIDETLRALDDLVRSGKVRYLGTSTFAAWQLVEALWVSKELGLHRVVCEQPPYHLLDRRIERELVPMAQTYGVALIPWSPLAGGFLSGKYRRGETAPPGSRLGQNHEGADPHFTDATFQVLDVVTALAHEQGATPSQVALAWVAQQPGVTSAIIGPRTRAHLEDCLGAMHVRLTAEDRARLDAVTPPGRAIVPYYEADFGPHRFRW